MRVLKNTVLLLKSEAEDGRDKYKNLLETNNFEVMLVKTLVFKYQNIDELKEELLQPQRFSGIIFSSPRCVNAVSQALGINQIRKLWESKSNFTVGETTFREALAKLGIECKGKESGNAKNLAHMIISNKNNFDKPFLFPHGNLKTDTLKLELDRENLSLKEVLVYDTLPNPDINDELTKCTKNFEEAPEYLVFFSPSGFHNSLEYLQKLGDLNSLKIVAIGPVTQLVIEQKNYKVHSIAKSPTPEEVLKAIIK